MTLKVNYLGRGILDIIFADTLIKNTFFLDLNLTTFENYRSQADFLNSNCFSDFKGGTPRGKCRFHGF
jgi:hypothetical protein